MKEASHEESGKEIENELEKYSRRIKRTPPKGRGRGVANTELARFDVEAKK